MEKEMEKMKEDFKPEMNGLVSFIKESLSEQRDREELKAKLIKIVPY